MLKKIVCLLILFSNDASVEALSFLNTDALASSVLSNYLQTASIANYDNLSSFRNSVINELSFNKNTFINIPSPSNSIYTKMQFFYDARTTQNSSFLNLLYQTLGDAKNKYFFDSATQQPNIINWYSIVGSEITLYNNFSTVLANCTSPSLLLTNLVQSASYNRTYYQDYPTTTNSIFYKILLFFQGRSTSLQTNISFLQNLLDLLNATMGKNFLTSAQNSSVISWITTVSGEKGKLDTLLAVFQSALNQYQNDPSSLNANIISNSNYFQSYLQNYPSTSFSIYTVLNALFTNREANYLLNKNFLTLLQTALTNAKTRPFLTADQQSVVNTWLTTLSQDITLTSGFSAAFSGATSVTTLTTLISTYNRKYFQNAPSSTSNIYTKIQTFFNQRSKTLADLTNLKNLLLVAQNKDCLTSTQNTDINSWIQTVNSEITSSSASANIYNFTYSSISGITGAAYSNSEWKISPAGNILLQFKANTSSNIYVHFYSSAVSNYVAWQQWGWYYHIKIDANETDIYCFNGETANIATAAGTSFSPNTSIKLTPNVTEDWWIILNNNNQIYVGKGTTPGQGAMGFWTIPSGFILARAPTYFGLGGSQSPTYYTNIQWTGTIPTISTTSSSSSSVTLASGSGGFSGTGGTVYIPSFTFNPATHGSSAVIFNSTNWIAPAGNEGNFAIKFRARGQKDFYVQLSPQPSTIVGNVYNLNIGGYNNTMTWVRNNTPGDGATTIGSVTTAANTLITGGLPGDGSVWDDYWVRITNNNTLSFGKSTAVGTNEVARWTISQPTNPSVKYFALGGYTSVIEYTNIQIEAAYAQALPPALVDQSIAIKANLTTDLANATTIDKLLLIINNSDYNKIYLQNYPTETNSIYTKLKDFFDKRIQNYINDTNTLKSLPSTLTNIQNLLDSAKIKDFLTGASTTEGQKNDVNSWSTTLASEKNLLASFEAKFATVSSINALNEIVTNSTFNTPLLIDYPNASNSIFTKMKWFAGIRSIVSNKNASFYTDLIMLLKNSNSKAFLSNSQNTEINNLVSTINQELVTLSDHKSQAQVQTTTPDTKSEQRVQQKLGKRPRLEEQRAQRMGRGERQQPPKIIIR